ncbi:MFS transporter [Pseudomonas citronellolis]|uniref:MFS transporter n=1 Tax=Pseudomonas citronellolis TaxID=53408 RepID=UPI000718666C|nr:MFS transporter [Pseudomonas citronellolis]KRV77239.1 hypothetical protein AO742_11600 [Pseudomonas citronellolis]KRW75711.1 hypothetical protein AO738_15550 [Pseudomonas citronellolis]WRT80496.1 MFS transporter [Pseudomonas citronellolis]
MSQLGVLSKSNVGSASADLASEAEEALLYRKITWRLIPFLLLAYVICYIDRANVSFAYLRFKDDIGLSDAAYGLGAGIFYLGYIVFELPSNILLEKLGARTTLMRIMVLWGLVSAGTAFVSSPEQFYIARILLGAAEAGFFPGLILYLTYWFPANRRGRVTSLLMLGLCIAGVIGGPVSGGILDLFEGSTVMKSWQWMFLLEGLPAVIIGFVAFFYLSDGPMDAKWLSEDEKRRVLANLERDQQGKVQQHGGKAVLLKLLTDPRVFIASVAYFFSPWALSVLNVWGPAIIKQSGVENAFAIGLLTIAPNLAGAIAMVYVGRRSDRHGERRWHFMFSVGITAIGSLMLASMHDNWVAATVFLTLVGIGQYAAFVVFWSIPPSYFSRTTAAAGIAIISSLGQVSGLLSSWILGILKEATGSMVIGLYLVTAIQILAGLLIVFGFRERVPAEKHTGH